MEGRKKWEGYSTDHPNVGIIVNLGVLRWKT